MKAGAVVSLLVASCFCAQLVFGAASKIDVFEKDERYGCYKIPYLLQTMSGKLLAMAEARGPADAPEGTSTGDCMDWDITDVVLRSSTDKGKTWSNMTVAIPGRFGLHTVAGNLAPVQDQRTGRIWLPFNRGNFELWITYSDDDGETWHEPKRMLQNEGSTWTWAGFGPPAGLQLSESHPYAGRLILPFYYSVFPIYDNGMLTSALMIYSDDGGETWQNGEPIPNGFFGIPRSIAGNENQVVELQDGRLLINSRTFAGSRISATSSDGGHTWTTMKKNDLPNPLFGCQGSMISHDNSTLLYSGTGGPNSKATRTRMTVWKSANSGDSWEEVQVLHDEGGVSYSAMQRLWSGEIAILYEISAGVETVFVPGSIVFEFVDVGLPAVPWTPLANFALFNVTSYDQSWVQEDGEAMVFVYSSSWYAFAVANGILMIFSIVLFIFVGLCPCCSCCGSAVRPLFDRAQARIKGFKEEDSVVQESVPEDDQGKERVWRVGKKLGLWLFKTVALVNLCFWSSGVVASYVFAFDDGGRWTKQSINCIIGLSISVIVSFGWFMFHRPSFINKCKSSNNPSPV